MCKVEWFCEGMGQNRMVCLFIYGSKETFKLLSEKLTDIGGYSIR